MYNGGVILKFSEIVKTFKLAFQLKHCKSVNDVIDMHFDNWSISNHESKPGLSKALCYFQKNSINIMETGTSAYGCESTRLFDFYIRKFGGTLISVDISAYPKKKLRFQTTKATYLKVGDSVDFLESRKYLNLISSIDLCYFDSFDLDWHNPLDSANHALSEFKAIEHHLSSKAVIVIDDTPNSIELVPIEARKQAMLFRDKFGVLPGKGALILNEIKTNKSWNIIHHESNLVIEKVN